MDTREPWEGELAKRHKNIAFLFKPTKNTLIHAFGGRGKGGMHETKRETSEEKYCEGNKAHQHKR